MKRPLITVLLLVGVVGVFGQGTETQTDWSGGPSVFGPVEHWGNRCLTADGVAWRSIAGRRIALSCTPLGQSVETVIGPDADHPRTCAVANLDGNGDAGQADLGILLARWGEGRR